MCADVGNYSGFYEALKAVYGPTHQVQSPLRSSDGQDLLTHNTAILARWTEHFQTLFSDNRTVQASSIVFPNFHSKKSSMSTEPTKRADPTRKELQCRRKLEKHH